MLRVTKGGETALFNRDSYDSRGVRDSARVLTDSPTPPEAHSPSLESDPPNDSLRLGAMHTLA